MPPIIVLAAGAFAAGAIVHRLIKEVRRKTGRAIDPVSQNRVSQKQHGQRLAEHQ